MDDFQSPYIANVLPDNHSNSRHRGHQGRKGANADPPFQSFSSATLLAPVNILPFNQNPLLADNEEDQFVPLNGDELALQNYEKMLQDTGEDCVYCNHGMNNEDFSKTELMQIHNLYQDNYGSISDRALYKWISEEYKRRIHNILTLREHIRTKRGQVNSAESIPYWSPESIENHFENHTLFPPKEWLDDIKTIKKVQKTVSYYGLAKNGIKKGSQKIDLDNAKLWLLFQDRKVKTIDKLVTSCPHLMGKYKKTEAQSGAKTGAQR